MKNAQTQEKPSFETVWAILQEVAQSQKETDRIIKERAEDFAKEQKENARERKENAREWRERADRLDKQLGKLGNRFGEMIEYMVKPNLVGKFRKIGFVFTKASSAPLHVEGENRILSEVDVFLENGDKVMIVETKSKPSTEDINDHVLRMEKLRIWADKRNDKRKYLGSIAGMVFNDNEKNYAKKCGFYVIELSGETFTITAPEGEYSPREW